MADIWDGGVGGSQVELEGDVEFRDELEQVAFQKVKTFADSARDAEWRRQHRVCVCVKQRLSDLSGLAAHLHVPHQA